jgi:hypothetical protein
MTTSETAPSFGTNPKAAGHRETVPPVLSTLRTHRSSVHAILSQGRCAHLWVGQELLDALFDGVADAADTREVVAFGPFNPALRLTNPYARR